MVTKKILVITTSQATYPNTDEPTGLWLEELAAPYLAFKEAGYEVDVFSIKGGKIPLDPNSLQPAALTETAKKFQNEASLKKVLEESGYIKDVKGDYDALFLPGGHGVAFDVAYDKDSIALVEKFFAAGKVVSAVCHGPVGLVEAKTPSGEPIVKGKNVAGFSNTEEEAVGKTSKVPYLLETALRNLGGHYTSGPDWSVYVKADGNLITGQNPQSSEKLAELVLKALK